MMKYYTDEYGDKFAVYVSNKNPEIGVKIPLQIHTCEDCGIALKTELLYQKRCCPLCKKIMIHTNPMRG